MSQNLSMTYANHLVSSLPRGAKTSKAFVQRCQTVSWTPCSARLNDKLIDAQLKTKIKAMYVIEALRGFVFSSSHGVLQGPTAEAVGFDPVHSRISSHQGGCGVPSAADRWSWAAAARTGGPCATAGGSCAAATRTRTTATADTQYIRPCAAHGYDYPGPGITIQRV